MIIDSKVNSEPRTWHITKVNRVSPDGIATVTLAQTHFDPHKDYIERDNDGNIVGMWADYYSNGEILPKDPEEFTTNIRCEVTTTGKPVIKINDTYKKFSVNFYKENELINLLDGEWTFAIKEKESGTVINLPDPSVLLLIKHYGEAKDLKENQIKTKYIGDMEYLNWILIVTYTGMKDSKKISSNIELDISRL